jgi:hypothetical protein
LTADELDLARRALGQVASYFGAASNEQFDDDFRRLMPDRGDGEEWVTGYVLASLVALQELAMATGRSVAEESALAALVLERTKVDDPLGGGLQAHEDGKRAVAFLAAQLASGIKERDYVSEFGTVVRAVGAHVVLLSLFVTHLSAARGETSEQTCQWLALRFEDYQ